MITWALSVNCITSNIEMGIMVLCISYSAAWGAGASLMAAHARHFECVQPQLVSITFIQLGLGTSSRRGQWATVKLEMTLEIVRNCRVLGNTGQYWMLWPGPGDHSSLLRVSDLCAGHGGDICHVMQAHLGQESHWENSHQYQSPLTIDIDKLTPTFMMVHMILCVSSCLLY